jgi:hypothetical protein
MALIIEDGSQVANSNTFITDAEYVAYAAARNLTIGVDAPTREIELILAVDYLTSIEQRFKGTRVESDQSLLYPRRNVIIFSDLFDQDSIPIQLKNSQAEAAAASNGQSLLTNESNQNVKRNRLDTLEQEFFEGGSWSVARLDRVNATLKELVIAGGFGRTVRIL